MVRMGMFFSSKKLRMPRPDEALPGRPTAMRVGEKHFVSGHRIVPPFPDGMQRAMFGMGCFWGAERKFWQTPRACTRPRSATPAASTPNPTYEEVCSGVTGHNEVVLVVYDPREVSYDQLLSAFWESHDPTQGMRQGNDAGTQYRSGIYAFDAGAEGRRRGVEGELRPAAGGGGLRADHHRDRRRARVLLRRGLPPAVPGQEPGRLLRAGRHRRVVPDRPGRGGGEVATAR